MATGQELEVQQKQEVAQAEESTRAVRYFVHFADIHETDDVLVISMEIPGVPRDDVEVMLEKDVLNVSGQVDFSGFEGLEPICTEYAVGHFSRSFSLASTIDQSGISASVDNGVLLLNLPKAREAQPRRVAVQ